MHRYWLIFAQAVTISVGVLFALQVLRPLGWTDSLAQLKSSTPPPVATLHEASPEHRSEAAAAMDGDGHRLAASRALPSVVYIYTSQAVRQRRNPLLNDPFFRHFFGEPPELRDRTQQRQGLGSGVIVDREGYILTNNHVVEGADAIEVALQDGEKYSAQLIGRDPESDLAVIRIQPEHDQPLPAITLAAPASLAVGDSVLAIGNPFGVGQTVTHGIVSALGRNHLGINTYENFIQTDAAINPGNSGGALVDAQGHLVGINTAIYSQSGGSMGIGFAIPVSQVKTVMEQIIEHGAVIRGWIGVEVQEITPDLAVSFQLKNTQGTLIAGVMRNGPAADAGIRPGDILLSVNGEAVVDPQTMLARIAAQRPGQSIPVRLLRNGRETQLNVLIGKRPTFRK